MTTLDVPARTVGGLAATLYREMLLLTRNRVNLILSIAPSLIYLVIVSGSFSSLIPTVQFDGRTVTYPEYLVATVVMSAVLSSALNVGTALFQEDMSRMALEIGAYPVRRRDYLLGKVVAGMSLMVVQSAAMMLLASAVLRTDWGPTAWLSLLAAGVVTGAAVTSLYLLLATLVKEFRRYSIIGGLSLQILLFASPSFYPQQSMAAFPRYLSYANPITYCLDSMRRAAFQGLASAAPLLAAMAVVTAVSCFAVLKCLTRRADRL
ncbi:ABC transporter permease [Streptacidiphilus albus]|uniref:ABC transporter permease n=1 Tax=Streptacidiphilus albus TaxID=105425 RepID=UPI00054B4A33|nr:ABC transporter permease [Streptacidiphilus albus]